MSNSELKVVKLSEITVSKTNPRKTFDEKSMAELTESVKQHGILQPILLRPWGSVEKKPRGRHTKGYQLVCGERRLRAATAADVKELPANIRELSDDEAFELQIIENLERKDVHPLEEAEAFKKMLDSGRYEVADIAAKIAKPDSYVAQRLKLNELIPEIRKDFYEGHLGVGHAVQLARVSAKQQSDYRHHAMEKTFSSGYGTVKNLIDSLSRGLNELNKAAFNVNDDQLAKGCGACSACPKRSGANKLLFSDVEQEDICFDVTCYENKLTAHIENEIAKIAMGESVAMLGHDYGTIPKFVEGLAKANKLPILQDYYDFSKDPKGKTKVLWISGSNAGKIVNVTLKKKSGSKAAAAEETPQDQINKIKERAKRALELDNEKVEAALREEIKAFPEAFKIKGEMPFAKLDASALCLCLISEVGYSAEVTLKKIGLSYHDWPAHSNWKKLADVDVHKLLPELLQLFVFKKLTDRQVSDRSSNGWSDAFYQMASTYYPKETGIIQLEQDEKANKRIERTNQRIAKLKEDLKKSK